MDLKHSELFRLPLSYLETPEYGEPEEEGFCIRVLQGVYRDKFGRSDEFEVHRAFSHHLDMLPLSAEDCRQELAFWDALDNLRAPNVPGEGIAYEATERYRIVEGLLEEFEAPDED